LIPADRSGNGFFPAVSGNDDQNYSIRLAKAYAAGHATAHRRLPLAMDTMRMESAAKVTPGMTLTLQAAAAGGGDQ